MQEALFVNFDPVLLDSLDLNDGKNRITSSLEESLLWIQDPAVAMSGIYFNPNDPSFSGLQFIEAVMQKRPVTPVFILDELGDFNSQHFASLSDKFKIRAVLKTQQEFANALKILQNSLPASIQMLGKRSDLVSAHAGHIAVPLMDFIYSRHYLANVFVEDESKELRFFAMEGSEVDLEYLSYLAKKTAWIYIEESSVESRMAAFQLVNAAYLDPAYLPPSWRTAETMFRAKRFLNDLQKHEISEELVGDTYSTFQNLFQLTSEFAQNVSLKNLIEQAKQSGRTIHSVILSVLLCKKLKYETSSVVENLGVASLLQNVSLYRSPYGNIAEADPEAMLEPIKSYYFNHPNASADLIANLTDISELTLQIIRQQHERFDRSGFPARVGGAQLQPLAEILSLINSYLDGNAHPENLYAHYSERVTTPFRQLVAALKEV